MAAWRARLPQVRSAELLRAGADGTGWTAGGPGGRGDWRPSSSLEETTCPACAAGQAAGTGPATSGASTLVTRGTGWGPDRGRQKLATPGYSPTRCGWRARPGQCRLQDASRRGQPEGRAVRPSLPRLPLCHLHSPFLFPVPSPSLQKPSSCFSSEEASLEIKIIKLMLPVRHPLLRHKLLKIILLRYN